MTTRPEVSVVIPTYRRVAGWQELFGALERQSVAPERFEVVVVDDCSGDGTYETVSRLAASAAITVRVLQTAHNSGAAGTRNLGWRAATAAYLAFLDDDCSPDPRWLESGYEALRSDPRLGLVQGATRAPAGFSPKDFGDHYVWRVIEDLTPEFEGCNIFYRREALDAAGGFDEEIGWGEDTSLGWRVVEAGWGRRFVAQASAEHPVERRGLRWLMVNGFRESSMITLAARHPGYRREAFWRPWAYRRTDACFVLAVAGVIATAAYRPAILAVLPYCWWRRPSIRRPAFLRLCLQLPAIDAARCAGQVSAAVKCRLLVV